MSKSTGKTRHFRHFPGQTVPKLGKDGRLHYCKRHRTRAEDIAAFWMRVKKGNPTECWLWRGSLHDKRGKYGKHVFGGRGIKVHRLSYMLHFGAIPHGQCVCHRCDVRLCVNPVHLFLATNEENTADRDRKHRVAFGERAGKAKLTEQQVIDIRRRYAAGGTSHRKLGAEYGIDYGAIRKIIIRKSWKHVIKE